MPTLSIKRLFDLQELDLQAASYEKSLAEVRATLSDDSAAVAAQGLKEKAESQLSDETAARRQIESAVQRLNERLQTAERRLYGGSVTAKSIEGFVAQPFIHGALVGGASLRADEFAEIVRITSRVKGG